MTIGNQARFALKFPWKCRWMLKITTLMKTPRVAVLALLVHLAGPLGALAQGSLVPPGAPAPMMKTLQQIEPRAPISAVPFLITNSGSYYLTTNLVGTSGHGIIISNSDVTVDLGGFVLRGGAGNGIIVPVLCSNVWVRNGTVRDWGLTGVSNSLAAASGVENVSSVNNGRDGISIGTGAVVRACVVISSGARGILAGPNSLVESCTVSDSGASSSISVGSRSQVLNCVVSQNPGTDGIITGAGSRVVGCISSANSRGIFLGNDCLVENCVVEGNSSIGIRTFNNNVVRNCLVRNNGNDGIFAVGHNLLVGNMCHGNGTNVTTGGAGIHMVAGGGNGTHIEGNSVHNNSWGIRVGTTNNIIIRNTASMNDTNYFIVTSNKVGVIIASPFSGAISGSTGGTGVGTTDPWANLSF